LGGNVMLATGVLRLRFDELSLVHCRALYLSRYAPSARGDLSSDKERLGVRRARQLIHRTLT